MSKAAILVVVVMIGGCSYTQPFGPQEQAQLPPKRTSLDEVLDCQTEIKDGYGISRQGFHWGGP